MAEIKIDLKINDLIKDIEEMSEGMVNDIQTAVAQLSKNVENEAARLAAQKLHGTYNDYINGLRREKQGDNLWVIYLEDDSFASRLEEGWSQFDMKKGFAESAKFREKGYVDIPLKQEPFSKTPASTKITDYRSAVEAVLKDKAVQKRIDEFNADSKGLNRYGQVERYDGIQNPKVKGLVKVTPPDQKQGTYILFRRVSKNTSPDKWIHPGFLGINIFENELKDYAEKELDNILNRILGGN